MLSHVATWSRNVIFSSATHTRTHTHTLCRFLCIRKKEKINSPVATLRGAIDPSPSQGGSPNEILQLCSGQFPATPIPRAINGPAPAKSSLGGSGTQAVRVRGLLGLEPRMGTGLGALSDREGDDDVIGFCSGAFPASQTQQRTVVHGVDSHAPSKGSHVETSDGVSSDSSSDAEGGGEEGEEGGVVMRWVQRHQQILSQGGVSEKKEVGTVKNWVGYESDSEMELDVDMPTIKRRKVKIKQRNG